MKKLIKLTDNLLLATEFDFLTIIDTNNSGLIYSSIKIRERVKKSGNCKTQMQIKRFINEKS